MKNQSSVLMLSYNIDQVACVYRLDIHLKGKNHEEGDFDQVIARELANHDPDGVRPMIGVSLGASMCLDPIPLVTDEGTFQRFLIFGGMNQVDGEYRNEVFQLLIDENNSNLVRWSRLTIAAGTKPPSPRNCHAMTRVGREMFIFGGWCSVDNAQLDENDEDDEEGVHGVVKGNETVLKVNDRIFWNDLYSFHLDHLTWRKIETFGIPPSPRCQSALLRMPPFLVHATQQSPLQQSLLERYEGTRYLMVVGGANHDIRVSLSSIIFDLLPLLKWIPSISIG